MKNKSELESKIQEWKSYQKDDDNYGYIRGTRYEPEEWYFLDEDTANELEDEAEAAEIELGEIESDEVWLDSFNEVLTGLGGQPLEFGDWVRVERLADEKLHQEREEKALVEFGAVD